MLIKNLEEITKEDSVIAGGKGASLGEMIKVGLPVPPGFVILSDAFDRFLTETDLNVEIDSILHTVNHKEIHTVEYASEKIQKLVLGFKIPENIEKEIRDEFQKLDAEFVAVRSSATAEDSLSSAWAGQLESFLNTNEETLILNIQKCWASLFTPRAIFYRFEQGLHSQKISVAVVVQKMVKSEMAGIAFSVHPVTEDRKQIIIEAVFGLGDAVVSGIVTPDSYVVEKEPRRIIDINIKEKTQVLSDLQILELSDLILKVENLYGFPCDIEWAYEKGKFYVTQSRPITTLIPKKDNNQEEWIQDRLFTSSLFNESLIFLRRNDIFLKEIGITYLHQIIVRWVGDFVLKEEQSKITEAKRKRFRSEFEFILKVNALEEKINSIINREDFSIEDDYCRIFDLMSEHFAYYGLAKEEAELIFEDPKTSLKDKNYIEKWRNNKERWDFHQKITEMISARTKITSETLDEMTVDEITKLFKGEQVDFDEIRKRVDSVWSLEKSNDILKIYLKDKSPLLKTEKGDSIVSGQVGYSTNEIITGVVGEDILVARKTSPDMIEKIQKSRAVITDEGGILSHAAITCRELKKPCIIGTKNATQVLHNGDLVQVDTKNGTVRITKKSK